MTLSNKREEGRVQEKLMSATAVRPSIRTGYAGGSGHRNGAGFTERAVLRALVQPTECEPKEHDCGSDEEGLQRLQRRRAPQAPLTLSISECRTMLRSTDSASTLGASHGCSSRAAARDGAGQRGRH